MTDSDRMLVQLKLDRALIRRVDHYAIDRDQYRARAIEDLIKAGLETHGGLPDHSSVGSRE